MAEHIDQDKVLEYMRSQVNEAAAEQCYLLMELRSLTQRVKTFEIESIAAKRRIKLLEQHCDALYQEVFGADLEHTLKAKAARAIRAIRTRFRGSDVQELQAGE